MSTLTIKDLDLTNQLDKQQMAGISGGIGRTPQQIRAWEATGLPATWEGLVLGDDNQLHKPAL